ncbi:MAG: cyclic nucleotide-binding domain-containing protein, partial [Proteobacteria bacterium]|nr:cyclic nucleotide-binding domain-containing protein [Pseudomonadota bacterium]
MSPHLEEPGQVFFHEGGVVDASCCGKRGIEAAYDLFGWTVGDFEFVHQPVKAERKIQSGIMELIMDGLRMLDEGQTLKLGPAPHPPDQRESPAKGTHLPIITRPVSNYAYVVDEDEILHGQTIVREGKYGNWASVILEGYADVIRDTPRGPLAISRLGPGALVGNISNLLAPRSVRTATLAAVGNVVLGVLDLQRLHSEFAVVSPVLRSYAISLDRRLRQVTDRVVETYLKTLVVEDFVLGRKTMFEEGQEEGLFRITAGSASVVKKTVKGLVPLVELTEGDFIGPCFFTNVGHEPQAMVLSTEDCTVSGVDLGALVEEFERISPMVRAIIEHEASCLAATTEILLDFEKMYPSEKS